MFKTKKDLEFMTDTSAAVLENVSMSAHIILWTAAIFVVVAVLWASFATLDEITRGEGKVIASSDMQVIQNLEGGIVDEILVAEGDIVEKDQVLMIIDDTQFSSSLKENQIKILALQVKKERLKAESEGRELKYSSKYKKYAPNMVEDELSLYRSRQDDLQVRLNILIGEKKGKEQELKELNRKQEQLKISFELIEKELKLTYPLIKEGAVSKVELLRLERTANDIKGELEQNKLAMPRIEADLENAQRRIEEVELEFQIEAKTELNALKAELKSSFESNLALFDKVKRTSVRSPVRGTVNQINVNTIGGIIRPGENVMEIVPLDDTLLIEAEIRPQDIGFIHPGLKAKIKLTAYDFSIYGGLEGSVVHISPTTIMNDKKENVYQIRLRTNENHIKKDDKIYPIIPGMRASIDILTGRKTVLDYILKPILKTKQKALTER